MKHTYFILFWFLNFYLLIFHWFLNNWALLEIFWLGQNQDWGQIVWPTKLELTSNIIYKYDNFKKKINCMNTILNYAETKAFEFINQFKTLKISVFVSYSDDFWIFFLPLVQNQLTSSCQFLKNLKNISTWFHSQE